MADYEVEKAIAEQIGFEQTLSSNRMNWNLTFQGFMMAAFALVASAELTSPTRIGLESVICIAGFVVGLGTWLGILASQRQRSYLRQRWRESVPGDSPYPRPFADSHGSQLGRSPTLIICFTIMIMWCVLQTLVILGMFAVSSGA